MSFSDRAATVGSRLMASVESMRSKISLPRWMIIPVIALLLVLSFLAWRQLPPDRSPSYQLAAVVAGLGVVSLFMNSIEFRLTAVLAGTTVSPMTSLRTVLTGTIANILPLPGSQIVRIAVLTSRGVPARLAVTRSLLVGAVWIAVAAALTVPLFFVDAGWPLLIIVLVISSLAAVVLTRSAERSPRRSIHITGLLATECSLVAFQVLRLLLLAKTLGIALSLSGGAALTLSATVATGAALLPSGLGLREGLSVLLGPLAGVERSEALVLSVADQALAYATFALIAAAALLFKRRLAADLAEVDQATTAV